MTHRPVPFGVFYGHRRLSNVRQPKPSVAQAVLDEEQEGEDHQSIAWAFQVMEAQGTRSTQQQQLPLHAEADAAIVAE